MIESASIPHVNRSKAMFQALLTSLFKIMYAFASFCLICV